MATATTCSPRPEDKAQRPRPADQGLKTWLGPAYGPILAEQTPTGLRAGDEVSKMLEPEWRRMYCMHVLYITQHPNTHKAPPETLPNTHHPHPAPFEIGYITLAQRRTGERDVSPEGSEWALRHKPNAQHICTCKSWYE